MMKKETFHNEGHVAAKNVVPATKREKKMNKNCLGSFQVLWNKNCNTQNEKKNENIDLKFISKETNKKRGNNQI